MAKFVGYYSALRPTQERVVVFTDNEDDAVVLLQQEIKLLKEQDLKDIVSCYQLHWMKKDD